MFWSKPWLPPIVALIPLYLMSNGFTFTFPSLKESAAFTSFKLSLLKSKNLTLEPKEVSKVEFLAFTAVERSCPNKSPESDFRSGVSAMASRFPLSLMVEFSFPLMIPAIGAIFFSISSWVKDCEMSTSFNPKFILNVGVFPLVETAPFTAIVPPKIEVFTFSKLTFSSLTINFPETSFIVKLS